LNGSGVESKSSTAPSSTVGTTFATGIKGQGAVFASGYMKYPSIANLAAINGNISVSAWVKITNQKLNPSAVSAISPIFSMTNPNEQVGNLSLFGNTHGLVSSDSIQMKAEFKVKKADGSTFGGDCLNMIKQEPWMDATHTWNANKIGGQWAHVVYVYESTAQGTFNRIYVNGVKISNSAWEKRDDAAIPFNQFSPTYPIIGALRSVADGTNLDTWNAALKGSVDEIRVWKKTLTQAQIGSLYELEKAGR